MRQTELGAEREEYFCLHVELLLMACMMDGVFRD